MARHSVTTECGECSAKFTVTSPSVELAQFCPFCGEGITLAYDDMDDEALLERDFDEDELDGFNEEDE